jgi:hypothetical protein
MKASWMENVIHGFKSRSLQPLGRICRVFRRNNYMFKEIYPPGLEKLAEEIVP